MDRRHLLQQMAFSESHHINRGVFPANTVAYDRTTGIWHFCRAKKIHDIHCSLNPTLPLSDAKLGTALKSSAMMASHQCMTSFKEPWPWGGKVRQILWLLLRQSSKDLLQSHHPFQLLPCPHYHPWTMDGPVLTRQMSAILPLKILYLGMSVGVWSWGFRIQRIASHFSFLGTTLYPVTWRVCCRKGLACCKQVKHTHTWIMLSILNSRF